MATTNLFVELLVIGVGAACWVLLFMLGLIGVDLFPLQAALGYPVLVFLLPLVYVLGIISDRMADFVFDKLFSGPLRARYFADRRDYQDARRLVISSSSRLANMHDYGRTRIRICRGWSLNALLIALALQFVMRAHVFTTPGSDAALTWAAAACVLLSMASWWSWYMICSWEYLKIHEHAEFLRQTSYQEPLKIAA
ncbi:MAG: hypothetical protein KDA86_06275 [Planctomycetaceae bacterium]|nr:hypothetical protein [Planctomycetaceae bacterium]